MGLVSLPSQQRPPPPAQNPAKCLNTTTSGDAGEGCASIWTLRVRLLLEFGGELSPKLGALVVDDCLWGAGVARFINPALVMAGVLVQPARFRSSPAVATSPAAGQPAQNSEFLALAQHPSLPQSSNRRMPPHTLIRGKVHLACLRSPQPQCSWHERSVGNDR